MLFIIILLLSIILVGILYYKRNRKKLEEQIEKNYLKENREKLYNQLNTEKQSIENGLLLEIDKLRAERDRLSEMVSAGEKIVEQLEKRKDESIRAFEYRENEQERILSSRKQELLSAIDELVAERRKSVDTEVQAYREVETQKATAAVTQWAATARSQEEVNLCAYRDEVALCKQKMQEELARTQQEIDTAKAELADYKKKQDVVNEAILRQRELDEKQDFYRVCLSEFTIEDITLLQEIRQKLHTSESLNKLIYDVYVSKAVQEMVKRVLQGGAPSGIYKITRLKTGEIYIGKSTNVKDRWQQHCRTVFGAGTIAHSILHTTMQKDGLQNFTFELVEEVPKDKLAEREKYWIDFYGSKKYGLNEKNG